MLVTLNQHAPAMQAHKLVDNVEPNAHAINVLIICIAGAVKTLKQVWNILSGNADPLVYHFNTCHAGFLTNPYLEHPAVGTIFYSITDQVLQHLFEA